MPDGRPRAPARAPTRRRARAARSERSYRACGRTCGYRRGTVSRLWLSTSGRAASTARSAASSPPRSGMSTSTVASGTAARTAAIGRRELRRAAVRQVVPRHAGDDDVPQAQAPRRFADPARLVRVQGAHAGGGRGAARGGCAASSALALALHGAEPAGARAHVAEDQEGRRAGGVALALVGAARLAADRVQLQLVEQGAGGAVLPRRRRLVLEPRRLAAGLLVGAVASRPGLVGASARRACRSGAGTALRGCARRARGRRARPRRPPRTASDGRGWCRRRRPA